MFLILLYPYNNIIVIDEKYPVILLSELLVNY